MWCLLKREACRFIGWLAFTFSLVNSMIVAMRVLWYGSSENYWLNYLLWFAISAGFYI
jgi:hypothetical protein